MFEVAKALIYREDQKILLQLRDNSSLISYPETWNFFGGEVEKNESPKEALFRELNEELEWSPQSAEFLLKWSNPKDGSLMHIFTVFCDVPSNHLIQHEGQTMDWYFVNELDQLFSGGFKNLIPRFKKFINSLN